VIKTNATAGTVLGVAEQLSNETVLKKLLEIICVLGIIRQRGRLSVTNCDSGDGP